MGDRDAAIEKLSERLYETMEHLDPSQEGIIWTALPDLERDFYRACVRALVRERDLLSLFCSHADGEQQQHDR